MASGAADLAHWLRLLLCPGIGTQGARRLLTAFGLPGEIFRAGRDALAAFVPAHVAQALAAPAADPQAIERSLAWAEQPGHAILTLADPGYPPQLLQIPDPPLLLYLHGRSELLSQPALAIVGSRNASAQGRANAENFAAAMCQAGYAIVSGLALGIDAAAHQGALCCAGATIAVIGTGADRIYPAANRQLAHAIAESGCIVSEYALGTPALAANFPRRNRIISALARGVLVVEAAAQSGSLITARLAAEQGREVFAIPGSIHAPLARGCHALIRQGAKLVETAADILEEFGALAVPPTAPPATALALPASALMELLGHDPVDIETLAQRCELDVATITAGLLALEMEGQAEMLADGRWARLS